MRTVIQFSKKKFGGWDYSIRYLRSSFGDKRGKISEIRISIWFLEGLRQSGEGVGWGGVVGGGWGRGALELFHSLSEIKSGAPTIKSGLGEGFCGLVLS